jgi:hypothetical protein
MAGSDGNRAVSDYALTNIDEDMRPGCEGPVSLALGVSGLSPMPPPRLRFTARRSLGRKRRRSADTGGLQLGG